MADQVPWWETCSDAELDERAANMTPPQLQEAFSALQARIQEHLATENTARLARTFYEGKRARLVAKSRDAFYARRVPKATAI